MRFHELSYMLTMPDDIVSIPTNLGDPPYTLFHGRFSSLLHMNQHSVRLGYLVRGVGFEPTNP